MQEGKHPKIPKVTKLANNKTKYGSSSHENLPFHCFHSNHPMPTDILTDSSQTSVQHARPNSHALHIYIKSNQTKIKSLKLQCTFDTYIFVG